MEQSLPPDPAAGTPRPWHDNWRDGLERLLNCRWVPPLLLALACGLVWGRSLGFQFVWDDHYFIVANPALRSPAHLLDLFTREDAQVWDPTGAHWGVYRPVRTLQYALLTWPWGQ
ncbi:MAG TPA: hypothetical protein VFU47_13840, partial [Armatimonadota bacterium]|nr:hypothetical protein [Armatimonadota bacterium]